LGDLVTLYRKAKQRFDETRLSRLLGEVVQLQAGAEDTRRACNCCVSNREEFQVIYDLLDVHLIERGDLL